MAELNETALRSGSTRGLQQETGLPGEVCEASVETLQREGFALKFVRFPEDALVVLRAVRDDRRCTTDAEKKEAAKEGAVVLRAKHCLTHSNRRECLNEILEAVAHPDPTRRVLATGKLLNAIRGYDPEDVIQTTWCEVMKKPAPLERKILGYPPFRLMSYLGGIAVRKRADIIREEIKDAWARESYSMRARDSETFMTKWLRDKGLGCVADFLASLNLPVTQRQDKDEREKVVAETVRRIVQVLFAEVDTPEDRVLRREGQEMYDRLFRLLHGFAETKLPPKELGVYEETRCGELRTVIDIKLPPAPSRGLFSAAPRGRHTAR